MKKNSIVFVDSSAWIAILDERNANYSSAREYFEKLLELSTRLVTNSLVIDDTLLFLKQNYSNEFAKNFLDIIDESAMSINLRVDWLSRRVRRNTLNNFLKSSNKNLQTRHFYIHETLKRKKVDIVFSYDQSLKYFDFPVMPQKA